MEEEVFAKVVDALIWEEYVAKLLGVLIHSDLSFNNNVKMICKKASQKLTSISRVTDIISKEKRITLLRSFFESQFSNCPLIGMLCSTSYTNRINRLHERALRIAYNNYMSNFEELLAWYNAVIFTGET